MTIPEYPITREEMYLDAIARGGGGGGGGGEAVLIPKTFTENGIYAASDDNADGYSEVTVDVQGSGGDPYAIARSLLANTATEYVDDTITYLRDGAFQGSAVTTIRCHAVTRIGTSGQPITFQKCAVTALAFPNLTGGTRRFEGAASLQRIDLGAGLTSVTRAEFFQCAQLNMLVLRKADGVVPLADTNSFNRTPFASGGSGGTIYIPQSLYAHLGDGSALDYKAATNWSTVNGYGTITWAVIEGSIYETQYVDGTPIPTT